MKTNKRSSLLGFMKDYLPDQWKLNIFSKSIESDPVDSHCPLFSQTGIKSVHDM